METAFFWIFSTIAVLSAISILFVTRPTRALLSLLLTMLCLAVLYTLLHAYFVAIVHIIVYAGAVMVLFLFIIMLGGLGATTLPIQKRFSPLHLFLASVTGITLMVAVIRIFSNANYPPLQNAMGTVERVGKNLFSNYIVPFELITVLILLGIFAAISLTRKPKDVE